MTLVLIDNYDSFTWNIYQYLAMLHPNIHVFRNDQTTLDHIISLSPTHIVISPGPGHPSTDAGISRDVINYFSGKVPVLGVCLGEQCIFEVFGGIVAHAGEIVHGKASEIRHDGKGVYVGLPEKGVMVTRYHSLAGRKDTLPADLVITSETESGVIMGVRHKMLCVEGVQFHPESILSGEDGRKMLENFLKMHAGTWAEQPEFGCALNEGDSNAKMKSYKAESGNVASVLLKIRDQRVKDVAETVKRPGQSLADLTALLRFAPPSIHLYQRLLSSLSTETGARVAVMAEIKRASPSKGPIALDVNAASQALIYAHAGAACISVLTEPTWFRGTMDDLKQVRMVLDSFPQRPAILRKDFIVDEYQIIEARLVGADSILLIVAILNDMQLKRFLGVSRKLGMEPVVEVNSTSEMKRAVDAGAKIIGVNNRNLHTFSVDTSTTSRLASMGVPSDVILCALSGMTSGNDARVYAESGVKAVLVGEALMRSKDPKAMIRDLSTCGEIATSNVLLEGGKVQRRVCVKICGVRTVSAAKAAVEAGADMIGLIFAEKSRRRVSVDTAREIIGAVRAMVNSLGLSKLVQPVVTHSKITSWHQMHVERLMSCSRRPFIVGVFQDQDVETVATIALDLGLDIIQLHGSEPEEAVKFLPRPVLRAFHVSGNVEHDRELSTSITRPGYHQHVLLDAKTVFDSSQTAGKHQGGQGKSFDWNVVDAITTTSDGERVPFVLAGGLNVYNVAEAVAQVRPWAVDVSSGVEGSDGDQDITLIQEFIRRAKDAVL